MGTCEIECWEVGDRGTHGIEPGVFVVCDVVHVLPHPSEADGHEVDGEIGDA